MGMQFRMTCLAIVIAGLWAMPARAEHGPGHGHGEAAKPADFDAIWLDLVEGNKRFIADVEKDRPLVKTREALYAGQAPKVIVLACADSRVTPALIFDKNLGELFEVRVAGNIADKIALGSMEYAVAHLSSSVIVVLGHERCGAVNAAASGEKMPTANLEALVGKIAPAIKDAKGDPMAMVKANVSASAQNLIDNSPVIKDAVEKKQIKIIKAVYKLKSGEVEKFE